MNLFTDTVSAAGAAPYIVRSIEQLNGQTLTFSVPAASASVLQGGTLKRLDPQSAVVLETFPLVASQTMTFGPYPTIRAWRLEVNAGSISYSLDRFDNDYATAIGNVEELIANRTLQVSDNGKLFINETGSAFTVTVPGTLPRGINIGFAQWGSGGSITIATANGATNRSSTTALNTQYAEGSLIVWKNSDGASAEFAVGGAFV